MFGHLDDRSPPTPGAPEMARVLRRATAVRRGQRRRIGLLAAACIVVAGAAAGLVAARASRVHLASTETAYQFDALKGPLPLGTPVPTTALVNVIFASPSKGFGLAVHRGQAILAITLDGGSTWAVQDDDPPPGFGQGDGHPGQMEFFGDHGFLWGGTTRFDGGAPLWVSDDSGLTWQKAPIGNGIIDVSAIGPNVWAVADACVAPAPAPCALTLDVSDSWGARWTTVPASALHDVGNTPDAGQPAELARITTERAYVLAAGLPSASGAGTALLYTPDGGASWLPRPTPCAGAYGLGAEIAASGTDDLWLLCGSQGSAGSQSKELYRSGDGGLTWSLTAAATGVGTPPPPAGQSNTLPLGGYIAPFSIGHKNLAVASPTTAWLKPFGSSLYKTVDGGRTWTPVADLASTELGQSGLGDITFLSATQGWICAYGVGLWHTDNGTAWKPLGF